MDNKGVNSKHSEIVRAKKHLTQKSFQRSPRQTIDIIFIRLWNLWRISFIDNGMCALMAYVDILLKLHRNSFFDYYVSYCHPVNILYALMVYFFINSINDFRNEDNHCSINTTKREF